MLVTKPFVAFSIHDSIEVTFFTMLANILGASHVKNKDREQFFKTNTGFFSGDLGRYHDPDSLSSYIDPES